VKSPPFPFAHDLSFVVLLGTILLFGAAGPATAAETPERPPAMTVWQSVVLGVVEGVTEYLPVSSTGHLILAQRLMGIGTAGAEKDAADAYAVCIQAGAILAVLGLYFRRIRQIALGLFGRDSEGRSLLINLAVAFSPAAAIGLAFEKTIKTYLFAGDHWGLWPIAGAWIVGGLVILIMDRTLLPRRRDGGGTTLAALTWRMALVIGFTQCLAMWPGVSRSLATILGGLLVGLALADAVEFSFLLGLMTLGASTAVDAMEHGRTIVQCYGVMRPLAGMAVAALSAAIAVKWMVGYLRRHPLALFGYYRIALGAAVIAMLLL
jgi:undecaprenyl-diphosphatase